MQCSSKGYTQRQTAKELHISEATVKAHLARINKALEVHSTEEAVCVAIKEGDIGGPELQGVRFDFLNGSDISIGHLVSLGQTNQEIGKKVGLSEHVIKNRLSELYEAIGVSNRVHFAALILKCALRS